MFRQIAFSFSLVHRVANDDEAATEVATWLCHVLPSLVFKIFFVSVSLFMHLSAVQRCRRFPSTGKTMQWQRRRQTPKKEEVEQCWHFPSLTHARTTSIFAQPVSFRPFLMYNVPQSLVSHLVTSCNSRLNEVISALMMMLVFIS